MEAGYVALYGKQRAGRAVLVQDTQQGDMSIWCSDVQGWMVCYAVYGVLWDISHVVFMLWLLFWCVCFYLLFVNMPS